MQHLNTDIIKKFNKTRYNPKFLCNAPFTSMNISFWETSPCCNNIDLIDDYSIANISEIWNGENYRQYRKAIRNGDLPDACSFCKNKLLNGEYESVKIHQYDTLKVSRIFPNKIRKIEVTLSNICNLECIMCHGVASSSIRINREKEEPIDFSYMQKFRTEIKPLLPYMQEIVFLGGEPFLNPLYYDIWEDMISINPKCKISVVTNGTILNDNIKSLIERGNFKINLSFDAITKETYETIRVNAKFEETMANMKYFGETLARQGKRLHIPICPLRANRFELPDLVRFCNDSKYSINFVDVLWATNVAMYSMTSSELKEIKDFYSRQTFMVTDTNSKKNITEFNELTQRIDRWIELAVRRENFKDIFDLKTDMVESLKKQLYEKISETLSRKNIDKDSINEQINQFKKTQDQLMSSLPEYYYSNHFFQKLLAVPSEKYITIMHQASMTYLKDAYKDLFFY